MNPKTNTQQVSDHSVVNQNQPKKPMHPGVMAKREAALKRIVGKKFDMLTVLDRPLIGTAKSVMIHCACDCGGEILAKLEQGRPRNKSCGCKHGGRFFHGHYCGDLETKAHMAWRSMIDRCYGKRPQHKTYRQRGIKVCSRWLNGEDGEKPFTLWLQDVGDPPTPLHSLDRIDNDGDYEPGNVQWSTAKQQANNRSNTKKLTLNGETKPLVYWSIQLGWPQHIIWSRLISGWSEEKALTTPVRKRNKPITK